MAVFTPVSEHDARQLLKRYPLGELVSLQGIAAGIENTNYFLTTTKGEYVLTLFEVLTHDQLPFYIELMHHLAANDIPVPRPQTMHDHTRLTTLHDRPTIIVARLEGGYEPEPGLRHCELAGQTLARMHKAAADFPIRQPNLRGLDWWQLTVPGLYEFLDASQRQLLDTSLAEQEQLAVGPTYQSLPEGPAHCDLFRDNVLFAGTFEQPRMGGFIDFYFAGCDKWLFDVAVSVNDWCIDRDTGILKTPELNAWLHAYARERAFTDAERACWPAMLRAAALRFWISRLNDYYRPRPAQTLKPHDPRHFERILQRRHQDDLPPLP